MVGGKHADVVVACLFAGIGAWGAKVTVSPNPYYASELFGSGHAAIEYPKDATATPPVDMTPIVTLTIPGNLNAQAADTTVTPAREASPARNHNGSAEVTITLLAGVLDANVTGLMYDANTSDDGAGENAPVPATAAVASIIDGGRKGDNFITIKVEEATAATDDGSRPAGSTDRAADGSIPESVADHAIFFELPSLASLGALAGADITDARGDNDEKTVWAQADSKLVSGQFQNGLISGGFPHYVVPVVRARDSVTLGITPSTTKTIAIDDDEAKDLSAFMSLKEKFKRTTYTEIATVTVRTSQERTPARDASGGDMYKIRAVDSGETRGSDTGIVYTDEMPEAEAKPWVLHDLDGTPIDDGLRGTLRMSASGTRDLFNDGDMLFIDYDKDEEMGSGEQIAIDGSSAVGDALSIDPDKSDSFDAGGTGSWKVFYMPGGKDTINHGSAIKLTANVDYSDPSAIDEAPRSSYATLNFDGVGNPVMAYAIPHSTNGTGDKGNVRVRCEEPSAGKEMCRIFVECWDDMGNRGFGEAPMVGDDSVMVWNGGDIEGVVGTDEPMSRHSCRLLSTGMITVQQLTRDGNSGTLVNNTYVGEAPPAVSHSDLHAAQCGAGGSENHEC